MGLQLLENKALSRDIIRKSACMLAEITIRKSQELAHTPVGGGIEVAEATDPCALSSRNGEIFSAKG